MPETLTIHRPGEPAKWTWFNVQHDLEVQGGLARENGAPVVMVDPLSVGPNSCGGEYNGNRFAITWMHDAFLLLSMADHSDELVGAFSRVLGYEPFCRYTETMDGSERPTRMPTVEWDKIDSEGRFKELEVKGKVDLQRLPPAPTTQAS